MIGSHERCPVIHRGPRAVVTLTAVRGRPAVRKEFLPGCERFCRREILARAELSARFPEIPPLLQHGELFVVSPYYPDTLSYRRESHRLFPLDVAHQVVDFLERLYESGFALLDAHPENLLVEADGRVRFFDFEFLRPYGEDRPPSFLESWDVVGPPPEFRGDLPRGGSPTWRTHWYPYVGLSIPDIKSGSVGKHRRKRIRHWATWLVPRRVDKRLPPAGLRLKHRLARLVRDRRGRGWERDVVRR